MYFIEKGKKLFSSAEEVVSMLLGLAIVVVVVSLVFSYFQNRKGDVTLPGISNNTDITTNKDTNGSESTSENKSEYVVVQGDNLWKIAENKYGDGFKWVEIAKENNISNPRLLAVGQKLTISQAQKLEESKENVTADNKYVVVKNDSLWKIAVKVYGDGYKWVDVWSANKDLITNPGMIYSGTRLTLPNLKS